MTAHELVRLAKSRPKEEREEILRSLKEIELHGHLKELLGRMEPNSLIEINHGAEERGIDLVMVRQDKFRKSVVGIVVKTGDIKGKTKGKIDEIKSQVDQALFHSVSLKAIPDRKLNATEVWIIIAGNLSKAAQERLEEVKTKGTNIDTSFGLDWLVENFTSYYPQVFYEGKVMDFLENKVRLLESSVPMFSQRGKFLSECYVEPLISEIDISEESDEEPLELISRKQKLPFSSLKGVIHPKAKILLFGEPGVGKSVALSNFVLEDFQQVWASAIKKELPEEMKIPLIFPANKLLEFDSYEALIRQFIYPQTEIYDRIKVTTIIIDGLDEVLSSQREELLEKTQNFAEQLNCSIIISTRNTDIVKDPPVGFKRYELLTFDFDRALKLYENISIDAEILAALKIGLARVILKVPLTPLILFLLLKLVEYHKEVPASITELYDQFSDIALGRYDYEKGIIVIFQHHIKKRFLAELAFKEFLEKKRLEVPEKEFNTFLANYAKVYGWDGEKLKEFIEEIERAGILDFKEALVSFRHGSFLDYFGAHYIWDNRENFENLEDFIVNIYFEDFWGDVAFYYIGLQRRLDISLLNKIFIYPKEDLATFVDKFLIGQLLQAGWHSTSDTLYQGIQKATNYAPIIKEESERIFEKRGENIPKIFFDSLVMRLSEQSFGSKILLKGGYDLLESLADPPTYHNVYRMLSLFCALERLLDKERSQKSVTAILGMLDRIPEQNIEEKARILTLLAIIGSKDDKMAKTLKRRAMQVFKRYPGIRKRVFGAPERKRFREK